MQHWRQWTAPCSAWGKYGAVVAIRAYPLPPPLPPPPIPPPLIHRSQLTQESFKKGGVLLTNYLSDRDIRTLVRKAERALERPDHGHSVTERTQASGTLPRRLPPCTSTRSSTAGTA